MKKFSSVAAGMILVAAILIYNNIVLPGTNEQTDANVPTEQTNLIMSAAQSDEDVSAVESSKSPISVTDHEGIVPGGTINVKIKRVVDGDTIRAYYQGEEYKVRLLCIDTPESVKENVKEQPYGKKAAERLEELISGNEVRMVFENEVKDRYDRLLAYILLEDGVCVNALMVSEGFARVNSVKPNTVHRDYFNGLMEEAIREEKGVWSLRPEERPFVKNDKGDYVPRYYEEEAA